MFQLRDTQARALQELDEWFGNHPTGNPIVSACVGAGKSILIAELCRRSIPFGARILILAPNKELLEQNLEKLEKSLRDADIRSIAVISASAGRKDCAIGKSVIIGTVGSLIKKPAALGRLDLIVIDECHRVSRTETGQYRQLISACMAFNPALRVVGFTGTPIRGNGVWLHSGDERLFTAIASSITIRESLALGHLSPLITLDTGLHIDAGDARMGNNGDFVLGDIARRLDIRELNESVVNSIVQHGQARKKWLVFASSISHAEHLAELINQAGYSVGLVTGETPKGQRNRIVTLFKEGRLRCICNVDVLTTGFDVPDLDMIALVRNTRSPVLYVQIAGRGLRIAPDKADCLWLDFTDTTSVMGPVDKVTGHDEVKTRLREGDVQTHKACPQCKTLMPLSATRCPNEDCGYELPRIPAINSYASDADILSRIRIKNYTVSATTYAAHSRPGKKPSMKVSYWVGMRVMCNEFICLEHNGFPKAKAIDWWQSRAFNPILPIPRTVSDAIEQRHYLREPECITVKEGDQYPELIGVTFKDRILITKGI